jgi:hypothetical protein
MDSPSQPGEEATTSAQGGRAEPGEASNYVHRTLSAAITCTGSPRRTSRDARAAAAHGHAARASA